MNGLQSQGVGASLKHFAVNSAEFDRMRISAEVDPRTLQEIYLRAFKKVVETAEPWTIMCSYNRINGTFAAENHWLLTSLLRDEWGYDGLVVSDWGAVSNRPKSTEAGLDLQMPPDDGVSDRILVDAVDAGEVSEAAVTLAAKRVARLAGRVLRGRAEVPAPEATEEFWDDHNDLAVEAAASGLVLLKNEGALLPLAKDNFGSLGEELAVVGTFAAEPRYQAGGSSHVNPTRLPSALEQIRSLAGADVKFEPGFGPDGDPNKAVELAANAKAAVLFLGLTPQEESEGFDRPTLDLPAAQVELFEKIARVQPNLVVVLSHGSALNLAPFTAAPAILDAALPGQGGGPAIAKVLFGEVNPSGKLTETLPLRLEDVPAYGNFPGEDGYVFYGERIWVGYRWYDKRDMEVAYPFGFGLSYTTFALSDLDVTYADDEVKATVSVTNTGSRAGREVAQLYVSKPDSPVQRAVRSLGGFASVFLEPGETKTVEITTPRFELAYWDVRSEGWVIEGGPYNIEVGHSSRDLPLGGTVVVEGDQVTVPLTLQSSLGELAAHPKGMDLIDRLAAQGGGIFGSGEDDAQEGVGVGMLELFQAIPLERLVALAGGGLSAEKMEGFLSEINP